MPDVPRESGRKKFGVAFRKYNRAIHRDLGHVAVGLTVVYALSGLAVNHINDWEPNYKTFEEVHELGGPVSGSDEEIAKSVMARLKVDETPRDTFHEGDEIQVVFDKHTLHINPKTGHVLDEGQRSRFFLRLANWLHLNRGKRAWTYVADAYAIGLLALALGGVLMYPGRMGIFGRGGIFLLIGIAIPVLYVTLSGGPEHASKSPISDSPGMETHLSATSQP
jgi:hypothetical protein